MIKGIACCVLLLTSTHLFADTQIISREFLNEHALKRLKVDAAVSALQTDLFGDSVHLSNGAVSLQNTDISLPTSALFPITISRKYVGPRQVAHNNLAFGDWELDIPMYYSQVVRDDVLSGSFSGIWGQGSPCDGNFNPNITSVGSEGFATPGEYWSGETVSFGNGQTEKMLLNAKSIGGSNRYLKNHKAECIENGVGKFKGIKITKPDGTSYYFNEPTLSPLQPISVYTNLGNTGVYSLISSYEARWLVSRIQDRFGNELTFHYQDSRLNKILSSSGDAIILEYEVNQYNKQRIKKITANNKSWLYEYKNATHYLSQDTLIAVTLPNNTKWQYSLNSLDDRPTNPTYREEYWNYINDDLRNVLTNIVETHCVKTQSIGTKQVSITHPSGAKLTLELDTRLFGRSNVPKLQTNSSFPVHAYNLCYSSLALIKRTIETNNDEALVWHYSYSENKGGWKGESSERLTLAHNNLLDGYNLEYLKATSIRNPDNSIVRHIFNRNWDSLDERELLNFTLDDNNNLLDSLKYDYQVIDSKGDSQAYTYSGYENSIEHSIDNPEPLNKEILTIKKVRTSYGNFGSKSVHVTDFSDFNELGWPEKTVEHDAQGGNKTVKQNYLNLYGAWVLGLPTSVSIIENDTATVVSSTSYYPETSPYKGLAFKQYQYGLLINTHEYNADGTLTKTTFNGVPNRWVSYSDYHRGVARNITVPQQNSTTGWLNARLEVDDFGRIKRVINFNGHQTDYSYDEIGRLTLINPLDPLWANTMFEYPVVNGYLHQVMQQGNKRQRIEFDGLLRPILTKTWDANNENATMQYHRQGFNHNNQPTFSSLLSSMEGETLGTHYEYDALGRKTKVIRPDGQSTQTEYLNGRHTRVTDAKGHQTTTTYLAYGEPSYDKPLAIFSPEGVTTSISYNLFGNINTVTQGGITELRLYDAYQRLCILNRPDVGTRAFAYNGLGELVYQVEGLTLQAGCIDVASQVNKTTLSYNNLGLLNKIDYADGSDDVHYLYDNQGQLTSLNTGNTLWGYRYNSLGLVEDETLTVDGKTFALDHIYNSLGLLSAQVYPSGRQVDYAPNALGQVSKAGTYAYSAAYYPSGQLKNFTYGNGLLHSVSLNSNQLPEDVNVTRGGSNMLFYRHAYDSNLNITGITDYVTANNNLSLDYDGLDRLINANGYWGSGSISYDTLGNIKTKNLGWQTLTYNYNSSNNRLTSITGSNPYSFQYDSRGNVTHNGKYSLSFNRANQLSTANGNSYVYDGHNRRVKKTNTGGSEYSFYSQDGRLYSTASSAGVKTDYIFLGNTLVARDDTGAAPPPPPTSNLPTINLSVERVSMGSSCPPRMVCANTSEIIGHLFRWTSTNANSCSGTVQKTLNGSFKGTDIFSLTAGSLTYQANGTVYLVSLTCTGPGGQASKQITASGTGSGLEM
jgi:YD repeat-containing protein